MGENNESQVFILKDYSRLQDGKDIDEKQAKRLYDLLQSVEEKGYQGKIYILSGDKIEERNKEIRIVKRYDNSYWTQQYIGIVKIEQTTVFIGSRFDKEDTNYFTNYVLEKALNIRSFIFPDMNPRVTSEDALQKLLIILFINQISKAYKKGILRQYRVYEENGDKVRGKIDVARHIKLNPIFQGKIAYSYREYTIDNDVNKLIFTAFSMIEKKEKELVNTLLNNNRDVKTYFQQLGNVMQPTSHQEIVKLIQRNKKPIHHSIYKCWEEVKQTAILILKHLGVNIAEKNETPMYGVLLNMNWIWEKYLENILKEISSETIKIKFQGEKQILFEEGKEEGKRILKPDFLIERKMVLDAKYKSVWSEIIEKNPEKWPSKSREDIFQVLSYMYVYKCKTGGIICPYQNDDKKDAIKCNLTEDNKEDNKEDTMIVFPLIIPQNSANYKKFEKKMRNNEENLREMIENMI